MRYEVFLAICLTTESAFYLVSNVEHTNAPIRNEKTTVVATNFELFDSLCQHPLFGEV